MNQNPQATPRPIVLHIGSLGRVLHAALRLERRLICMRERRLIRREAIRNGTISIDSSLMTRLTARYHHCMQNFAAESLRRIFSKYWPFHWAYVKVGGKFGSAIQAFFGFSEQLLLLNLALGMVWLPLVVVPQLLLNEASRNIVDDLLAIVGLVDYEARWKAGKQADPQLLYMGGCRGEVPDPDRLLGADVWHMGTAYLCALGVTYLISLCWIVRTLGIKMAEGSGGGGGNALGNNRKILELIFTGWDHLEVGTSATHMQRRTLVKQIEEEVETASE